MSNPPSRQKPAASPRRGKRALPQPARWAVQFYYDPRTAQTSPHPGSDPAKTADIILRFRRNVEDDNARPALQEVIDRAVGRNPPVDGFLICFGWKGKYVREDLDFACSALIAQLTEDRGFAEVSRKGFILSGYLTKAPADRQSQDPHPSPLPEVPPPPAPTPDRAAPRLTPEQARAELDAIVAAIGDPKSHFADRLRAVLAASHNLPPELTKRAQAIRGQIENLAAAPSRVAPVSAVPPSSSGAELLAYYRTAFGLMDRGIDEVHEPLIETFQQAIALMEGKSFESYEENQEVTQLVQHTAHRLGVCFVCSKPGCGKPSRLRCYKVERTEGVFQFEHVPDEAPKRHSAGSSIPALKLHSPPETPETT